MSTNDRQPVTARPMNPLQERLYAWSEALTLRFVSPAGPGRLMKWFYRGPVWLYRVRLGWIVGGSTLLLTVRGRRTGKWRSVALGYNYDQAQDAYVVVSGWAERSDWYRNAMADPHVRVQVGRRRFETTVERLPLEEAVEVHREYIARNPRQERSLPHLTGEPFDGSEAALRLAAEKCPVLLLRPSR
jgi:deazaflavin-dependent oxidoreductase (nitroreductase family)